MSVLLTVSKTMYGSGVADTLAGGGGTNTGLDLGSVVNGQYTPISNQSTNAGAQDLYIYHNAVVDPITSVGTYVQQYGTGTSYAYGGADTAAHDLTTILNYGNNDTSTVANNGDGLSGGLHIDMDWQVSQTNQFGFSRRGTQHRYYGNAGGVSGDGSSLSTAITMYVDALSYSSTHAAGGTETDATTPVAGKIGKNGDTVLGEQAHIKMRFYLPTSAVNGGIVQWEWVIAYSYTA